MRYTYKLKELAKELCEKSGCHHKCHDTSDCVVEDEAKEVIANSATTTEKQIDEIARIIDDNHGFIVSSVETAKALYSAGYRKQSEGEWTYDYTGEELLGTDAVYQYKCSLCGEHSIVPWRYCPDCGAKMKGGEE